MPSNKNSDKKNDLVGIGLVLLSVVVSLWLAATNQLGLYIHPRYIIFTSILSAIALIIIIFGSKYREPGPHDANHEHSKPAEPLKLNIFNMISMVICTFGVLALLIIKPAPLTSATANQRGINAAAATTSSAGSNAITSKQIASSPLFAGNDYSSFTIKDWAGLMAQTNQASFFAGKNVAVTGFVTADQYDSKNVFYISKFVITCCAVDARPIGLAVYDPGWQSKFKNNDWLTITGAFANNPSAINQDPVAIIPTKLQVIPQPDKVYDY